MTMSRLICVGVFLGAHGVRGQVRLASLTEDPEAIFSYAPLTDETGARVFDLTVRGVSKDGFLVSVDGIEDRDAAQALKGTEVFAQRDALPQQEEGGFYCADLLGLQVRDGGGVTMGTVEDVHDYGAGTFLEIKPVKGKTFMLPFKDAFVPVVDLDGGFLQAEIPDGWLSEEKEPAKKTKNKPEAR